MPASAVSRMPCTLRAAQRDCDSYMAHVALHVTAMLPLVRLAGLNDRVYRDEATSAWARCVTHPHLAWMAWPGSRALMGASNVTGCGPKERPQFDLRRSRSTWRRTTLNEAFNFHQHRTAGCAPAVRLLADQARCREPARKPQRQGAPSSAECAFARCTRAGACTCCSTGRCGR